MNSSPDISDGVYFQLAAEEYHAIPALSASGIRNLLISGPDFWYRTPWLNAAYVDEDSEAMKIGRAYHTRILEGRDVFYQNYAQTFEAPVDCLKTVDDLKDALIKCGIEKPKGLKGDLIEQLLEVQPNAKIYDELIADYHVLHHGKEFLSEKLIASIEVAAAMIEKHPEISKCFSGGYPEVTVVWTETDIRFKARFDYLKARAIIDLKTFGNFMNKPIDSAIYSAMASGKYHIQAAFYMRAFEAAQRQPHWHGCDLAFRDEHKKCAEPGFYFVFQQKGIAPLARCKKFTRGSLWSCGEVAIEEAIKRFRENMARYGELPWVDDGVIEEFQDDHFPAYTTEL
jgi:hypothetical protein